MKPKNVIAGVLCLGIVALFLSSGVQAQELREVNAKYILKQIEKGEDIFLENVRITGELDLNKIELETVIRSERVIPPEELKIVESKIELWNSVFEDDVDFSNTQFRKDVVFGGTSFLGKIDFFGAVFSSNANFRNADFSGGADFKSADFSGDADFKDARFNQIYVSWSSLKDALVFDGPTYIKIIKNLREEEQFEDADAAYYQYRRLSQKNKKWSFSKLMDVVAGASCGYGVKPDRPVIWAGILIMVFALVYWRGKGIKRLKENGGDNNRVSRWAAFYNAFYFSVVTFTTVGYGDWYPKDRYRIVVMIEGVLGWLLLALFIVTLANVMIRP